MRIHRCFLYAVLCAGAIGLGLTGCGEDNPTDLEGPATTDEGALRAMMDGQAGYFDGGQGVSDGQVEVGTPGPRGADGAPIESFNFVREILRRDIEKYYLTIFGEPSAAGTWGMRWEGHHVSLHWTVVRGTAIATTPQFFGSNPAEVREGPKKGQRALAAEEDLGRALVTALTPAQRPVAVVAPEAPSDILTTNTRKAAIQANTGLAYADMTAEQRGMLLALITEYADAQPKKLALERIARLRAARLDGIKFAWMGGIEKGALHYYRVQGPTFLIEYDCVQNGGNHIHAVWRDFDGDFGLDLLEQHYKKSAHHQKR